MKNSRANISARWSFLRRAFFIPVSLLRTSLNIIVEFIFTVVTARKVRTWQTSNHCLKFARGLRSTKKNLRQVVKTTALSFLTATAHSS
jgi:hypothetical protein